MTRDTELIVHSMTLVRKREHLTCTVSVSLARVTSHRLLVLAGLVWPEGRLCQHQQLLLLVSERRERD